MATVDKATLWRFYTEKVNPEGIAREVAATFHEGATLLTGTGIWDGGTEESMIIEVITQDLSMHEAEAFAERIRAMNNQFSVLITYTPVNSIYIENR